jgi:YtkA-like
MKKTMLFLTMGILALFISACGNSSGDEPAEKDNNMEPIEAKLEVPKKSGKGEAVTLNTKVTQGKEHVDDADEVKYEIWKNGHKDESEMIAAEQKKDGVYTAEKTFNEVGIYTVQVHVTARDMHTMPKAEITVGNAGEEDHAEKGGDPHNGHHESTVSIHLVKPDTIKAGEKAEWKVHVENEGEALEGAELRLEIYKDDQEKHVWVDMTAGEPGEYNVAYSFPEKGSYNVQVHVTKGDEIHEHTMQTVKVQ